MVYCCPPRVCSFALAHDAQLHQSQFVLLLVRCSLVSSSFGRISRNNTTDTFFFKAAVRKPFKKYYLNLAKLSFELGKTTTTLLDCSILMRSHMMRNCTKAVLLVGFCSYAARWSRRLPFKNSLIRARVAQKCDICDQKGSVNIESEHFKERHFETLNIKRSATIFKIVRFASL